MTTLLAFLATLAILIVFHEFGHYLVARLAGVKVLRFSVGFGKVVAQRRDRQGTEWALSAIPLGGYVKMLDEREAPVPPDQLDGAFNRKPLGARAAIVAAGPLANFLLAVLLFWGLFMMGVPTLKPVLGEPPAGSPAALAGIRAGDMVTAVNGEPVESFQDLHWLALRHVIGNDQLRVDIVDDKGHLSYRTLTVDERDAGFEQAPLAALGLQRFRPALPPVLGGLAAGGVAERAGLLEGDLILGIDDSPVEQWEQVVNLVRAAPGKPLRVQVERQGQMIELTLIPAQINEGGQTVGRIGAAPRLDHAALSKYQGEVRYGPWEAMTRALARTWDLSVFSLEMLGRMIIGQVSLKNLSGPLPSPITPASPRPPARPPSSPFWPLSASASACSISCPCRYWMGDTCCIISPNF